MKLYNTSLLLLALLCLTVVTLPVVAFDINYGTLYSNGPAYASDTFAWDIGNNLGTMVSNSFLLGGASSVNAFSFSLWIYPGDFLDAVSWSITSQHSGLGVVEASGTALAGFDLSYGKFLFDNTLTGTPVYSFTVKGINLPLAGGTYWLNLFDASVASGSPVGWDENNGVGCTSPGCPSSAWVGYGSTATSIGLKSEDPDILTIIDGTTPEPNSFILFGSGILGLAAVLRRKLF